jgi:hypothetical protein
MLLPNILRCIEISVQGVPTLTTFEEALRATVRAMLITTRTTRLTGVAGVYLCDAYPSLLPLVGNEVVELGKRPTVQASFVINVLLALASSHFRGVADVGQIFEDESRACRCMLDKTFGEDVIAVPVEAQSAARQLLEMSFRAFCPFGLQLSLEAETTPFYFFPVTRAKKLPVRGDGWTVQTEVNADHCIVFGNIGFRNGYDNMQPVLPIAIAQISRSNGIAKVFGTVSGNGEGKKQPSLRARKVDVMGIPVQPVCVKIVADRTEFDLWTVDRVEDRSGLALLECLSDSLSIMRFLLFLPGQCRLDRFGSLGTGLDEQIAYQSRTGRFRVIIGSMMQLHPVFLLMLPPIGNNMIKSLSKLFQRLLKSLSLLRGGMQLYLDRSVHTRLIPYMSSFGNKKKEAAVFPSLPLKA